MTGRELAYEVYQCLPQESRKRIKKEEVNSIVKLVFETISEAIMVNDAVRIRNFGSIRARFITGGKVVFCAPMNKSYPRKPNIKLIFTPSHRLRTRVSRERMRMRAHARKERLEKEVRSVPTSFAGVVEEDKKDGKVQLRA